MIVFIFLLCFIASTIGGICGIGGGAVIKPLLDATDIMSVPTASFLSGITVLSMACINVWKNRKRNELELSRSLPLGVGAAIGGIVGKQVFSLLKDTVQADHIVGAVQAITLAVLVLGTLIYVLFKSRIRSKDIQGWFVPVVIGLLLGFCSSFLGIGGGPMNLAVLYYFFSMDTKKAVVNSILIILISQVASLTMTLVTWTVPDFEWSHLIAMVIAGALGGNLSAKLHKKLSTDMTDNLFVGLLIVIICLCIYNAVRMLI